VLRNERADNCGALFEEGTILVSGSTWRVTVNVNLADYLASDPIGTTISDFVSSEHARYRGSAATLSIMTVFP